MADDTERFSATQMYMIWASFHVHGVVFCPACGALLKVEVMEPAEGGSASIKARCPKCGRTGEHVIR